MIPAVTSNAGVAKELGAYVEQLSAHRNQLQDDLRPVLARASHARVTAIGGTTRGAHEHAEQVRELVIMLVGSGFRSIVLEEDWTICLALDAAVAEKNGDPAAVLAGARPFWSTHEFLETLSWIRAHNMKFPEDRVRIVGLNADATGPAAYDAVEQIVREVAPSRAAELTTCLDALRPTRPIAEHAAAYRASNDSPYTIALARRAHGIVAAMPEGKKRTLALRHARAIVDFYEYHARTRGAILSYATPRMAQNVLWCWERYGHRIIYLGGIAQTAAASQRSLPGYVTDEPSVGGLLRRLLGGAYVSVGLTFGRGKVPQPIGPPPDDLAEAALDAATSRDCCLLDPHMNAPARLRAWLETPAKIRVIGPDYVPERDSDHVMVGGSLSEWFDLVVHTRAVTPLRQLEPERARSW